jgi:hypothetical protein
MVDIEDYKAALETAQRNNALKGMGHHDVLYIYLRNFEKRLKKD